MVVELASALAAREDDLDTRVEFVCYGAEEVGLVGSSYHADRTDLDSIRAVVNNDGVCRGRTLQLTTNTFDELGAVAESVSEAFDHPITVDPTCGPHSDHWPYVVEGVPGTHVMSETDGEGRGWGHTHADTLDKVDVRNLRESAILLTEYVVRAAEADREFPRADPGRIADALEAEGQAEGMKVIGDWPFGE
jgi:Zn-dependent M28 family amino/carboxypeptidase